MVQTTPVIIEVQVEVAEVATTVVEAVGLTVINTTHWVVEVVEVAQAFCLMDLIVIKIITTVMDTF